MIKLYQFPISHYCEKIRWSLDYKNLDYEIINLLPGLHIKITKKLAKHSSVPVLVDGEHVIQCSDAIINYLDKTYPDNQLTPSDEELKNNALEWEAYVDTELGVHVRRCLYHILLEHPEIVIPFFTSNGPWYGKLLIKLSFPKLRSRMRALMKINEVTAAESKISMSNGIDKVFERLQQHKFLAGNEFSRADLSAASLLAPLRMPDKYGLAWPSEIPTELEIFLAEFEEKTAWVDDVYHEFR